MARMPNPGVLAEVLGSGNLRARLRAAREGIAGVRLQLILSFNPVPLPGWIGVIRGLA